MIEFTQHFSDWHFILPLLLPIVVDFDHEIDGSVGIEVREVEFELVFLVGKIFLFASIL